MNEHSKPFYVISIPMAFVGIEKAKGSPPHWLAIFEKELEGARKRIEGVFIDSFNPYV